MSLLLSKLKTHASKGVLAGALASAAVLSAGDAQAVTSLKLFDFSGSTLSHQCVGLACSLGNFTFEFGAFAASAGSAGSATLTEINPRSYTVSVNYVNPATSGIFNYTAKTSLPSFALGAINSDTNLGVVTQLSTSIGGLGFTSVNGMPDGPTSLTGTSLEVTNTLSAFSSFNNISNQYTMVPGPLPILGAAAFFGYSRKLRKRISQLA